MWQSYFFEIQSKYNMRVSTTRPLVIRLDGKNVTKSKEFDLLKNPESFSDILEKTVKYFTEKYRCLAIFGSDEVSFIFENPMRVIEDLDKDKVNRVNEIISLFSQYFFDYFNELYGKTKVFWHAKCFTINEDKIISYLKYRSKIIRNVMTTYFLKKKKIYMGNEKMNIREAECEKYADYEALKEYQDGTLYFDGKKIDLSEYYKGNIKEIKYNTENDFFVDLSEI